jgi:F420-non-reducing hydrogenase iron-sulfur subunit
LKIRISKFEIRNNLKFSKLVLRTPHPAGGSPVSNDQNILGIPICLVSNIRKLGFRICFGFRASDFGFIFFNNLQQIEASCKGQITMAGEFEPKIIAFCCNWCSYAGADLAGVSRLQYPPNIRVIRVMCSGRISPDFVLKAFQMGADGVLVSG